MRTSSKWRTRRVSRGRLLTVVALAVVSALAAASGLDDKAAQGITVIARFADASPLLVGNDVKVDGVTVGTVSAMNVINGHEAAVALTLNRAALPVHNDARVTIKPVSLLGERYIDLDRGSPSTAVLADGGSVPVRQTGVQPDLYQVLNTVDDPTGRSLSALVAMAGDGLRGNGANADASVRLLTSAMRNTNGLAKTLNEQNGLLNDVVDKVQPVANALAHDNGNTLDGLLNSTQRLTATTADSQRQLERTIQALPGTLQQARGTLAQLSGTADAAVPTLREMRPTTDNFTAISEEIDRFADTANPALASTKPVLQKAQRLLDQARPVTAELRKAGPNVRGVSANARPLVSALTANLDNVLNYVRDWALTTNGHDGVSHYFRAMLTVNGDIATGITGSPKQAAPGKRFAKPTGGGEGGLLGGGKGGLLGDGHGSQPGLLAPSKTSGGSATGLNSQQESGALQLLLGGGQ